MRFQKGHPTELVYPLTSLPTGPTQLASPRIGNAHGLPTPTYPGDEGFDQELYEVLEISSEVCANVWPSWFFEKYGVDPEVPEPLRMEGISERYPKKAAHIVHMDLPGDLGRILFTYLASKNLKLNATPSHKGIPFLETVPTLQLEIAKEIQIALEKAFEAKYYFGRPRPEEVVGYNCTYYPEGCPTHPAYPAGHGAVSGATNKAFNTILDLGEYKQVVEDTTKHFCLYRSLSRVHYGNDNTSGWGLGNG